MGLVMVFVWLLMAVVLVVYGNLQGNKFLMGLGAVMVLMVAMVVTID